MESACLGVAPAAFRPCTVGARTALQLTGQVPTLRSGAHLPSISKEFRVLLGGRAAGRIKGKDAMDFGHISSGELLTHAAGLRRLAMLLVADETDSERPDHSTPGADPRQPPAPSRWRSDRTLAPGDRREAGLEYTDLVERVKLHQLVATEVVRLPEPYRTALLSLYFNEVPVERRGASSATFQTQVERGIQLLREGLDARPLGNRSDWRARMADLAGSRPDYR